jgi:hypothetical protein
LPAKGHLVETKGLDRGFLVVYSLLRIPGATGAERGRAHEAGPRRSADGPFGALADLV